MHIKTDTHSHTPTLIHTLTHTHPCSYAHTLLHTWTHMHSHAHAHSYTYSHIYSHTHALTHSHTLTHSHIHSYTRRHFHKGAQYLFLHFSFGNLSPVVHIDLFHSFYWLRCTPVPRCTIIYSGLSCRALRMFPLYVFALSSNVVLNNLISISMFICGVEVMSQRLYTVAILITSGQLLNRKLQLHLLS